MVLTKNRGFRLILKHLNLCLKTWDFMALSKISYSTNSYVFYGSLGDASNSVHKRRSGLSLNLRSCLNRNEKSAKAIAISRNRYLVNKEEVGSKLVKENGSCKQGKPSEVGKRSIDNKLVVAVDVDEVLGSFLTALNKFIADRYLSKHAISEYSVYEFFRIWNCSRAEADIRVHEFFKTDYFTLGIHPIPGARHALQKLSTFCNLSVVTSRQNVVKGHTIDWIEKHYPGLFQEIHFGNHFALDGTSKPKSVICGSFGAHVLIDDNPRYALECAEIGMKVLLFDYHNSYPWSKSEKVESHPLVTKVCNWDEVEKHLVSWATILS